MQTPKRRTLDKKDVYDSLYWTIEQTVLDAYLINSNRRWRGFYKHMSEYGMIGYEEQRLSDPSVSIHMSKNTKDLKITITITPNDITTIT